MAKTIVGLYEDRTTAHRVVDALQSAGFGDDHVQFASHEGGGPGSFETDASSFAATDTLTGYGIDRGEADFYAEGLRRGGSLVVVRAQEADAETAVDIMSEHNPVRYEDRSAAYRQEGFSTYDASAPAYSADQMQTERSRYAEQGQQRLQEIQESLKVGKRDVVRGGVRVHTRVDSERVEETVRLREETARVERTAVDRELSPEEANAAFQEQTIEITERGEEAVVQKTAHVTGEVTVGTEVTERQETVGDTLRSTHVEVEQTGGMDDMSGYQSHFQSTYGTSGRQFDTYRPAYDYGHQARSQYGDRSFSEVESSMRTDYEGRYGRDGDSAWDNVKDAVRHAFEGAKRATR